MTRIVLALIASLLALPVAAQAAPQGSTILQSRSTGLDPFGAGGANTSGMHRWAVSADGCRVAFESEGDGLSPDDNDRVKNVFVRDACEGETILASRASGATGAAGNGASSFASISPNGRYVAFMSSSTNFASQSANGLVYRRDLETDTTVLISRRMSAPNTVGALQGEAPTVANDGKVAFGTSAVLDPADTNGVNGDIYVGDGTTTTLVSRNEAGPVAAQMQAISHDGTAVAFITSTSLHPDDTNTGFDVYVRKNGVNTLMSRTNGASGAAAGSAQRPTINADGSVVAWLTTAAVDAAKDTNDSTDVYRRKGDATVLVTRRDGADTAAGAGSSVMPSMDATGDRVAFVYAANDLTSDTAVAGSDVFLRDVPADRTILLTRAGADGDALGGVGSTAVLAAGGTHVVFPTDGDGVLAGDADDFTQIVRRRLSDGAVDQVSRPDGTGPYDGGGVNAGAGGRDVVSRDGRYVAFMSDSDALRISGAGAGRHAFVRDNKTGTTTQVDVASDGTASAGGVSEIALSDDGRRVAFVTTDRLGGALDTNPAADAYVRDLEAGTTVLASRGAGDAASTGYIVAELAISGDGRRVAFVTQAKFDDLDTNNSQDVYLRDVAAKTTTLVSRGANGSAGGHAPAVDEDGSRVAFETTSSLHEHDAAILDVYVRDLPAGTTLLVSRADGDGAGATAHSSGPSISADGNRVAFQTAATNIGDGATNGHVHVHVRDIAAGKTVLVSKTEAGEQGNGTNAGASISADGTRVAFDSFAATLDAGAGIQQVLVKDLDSGRLTLASVAHGAAGAKAGRAARQPAISANGRCVAFTSAAALTPGVHTPGDFEQVFLRAVSGDCPDETAPDTTITEAPAVRTDDIDVEFAFTSSEGGDRFECSADGGDWYECSQTAQWDSVAEGSHTFRVRAIDASGNVDQTPAAAEFYVDLTVPETAIDTQVPSRTKDTSVEIAFSGSDDAFFACRLDGGDWEDCDPPSRTLEGLTDGEHTFEVRAYDFVGHVDATPAAVTFAVDTEGPAAAIASVTATDDGAAAATFTGPAGVTFRCATDGGAFAACTSPLRLAGLTAGDHKLRVQAIDDLGNEGPVVERTFTVPARPVVEQPRTETRSDPAPVPPAGSPATAPSPAPAQAPSSSAPRSVVAGIAAKVLKTTVKRGVALVTLDCPKTATAGCRGAVTLRAKKLGVVARGSYTVAAGKRTTLRLKLKGKARKAKRLTARAA